MTRAEVGIAPTRTRASKSAILASLEALREAGLPVEKVCVNGGKVEIHCSPVEGQKDARNDEGLEKW